MAEPLRHPGVKFPPPILFVLGALIGSEVGTLFMLGGGVAFLIGLYEYVR